MPKFIKYVTIITFLLLSTTISAFSQIHAETCSKKHVFANSSSCLIDSFGNIPSRNITLRTLGRRTPWKVFPFKEETIDINFSTIMEKASLNATVISNSTIIFKNTTIILNQSLLINKNSRLIIENSTIIINSTEHTYIIANQSYLKISSTKIRTLHGAPLSIIITNSSKAIITNNDLSNTSYIIAYDSHIQITNNAITRTSQRHIILLLNASNSIIAYNKLSQLSTRGNIYVLYSQNVTIHGNYLKEITNFDFYAINVYRSENISIVGNIISDSSYGVRISRSANFEVKKNVIDSMGRALGIILCRNYSIKENIIANSTYLALIYGSKFGYVYNNILRGIFDWGVSIVNSFDTQIFNNTIIGEVNYLYIFPYLFEGISTERNYNISIINNTLYNSGIFIFEDLERIRTYIFENNYLNGYPILLLIEGKGVIFENTRLGGLLIYYSKNVSIENTSIGYIIVRKTENITIQNSTIAGTTTAIYIRSSSDISILNLRAQGEIYMIKCRDISIFNLVTELMSKTKHYLVYGIFISDSQNIALDKISVNNSMYSVRIYNSTFISISNSIIFSRQAGIAVSGSENLKIYNCKLLAPPLYYGAHFISIDFTVSVEIKYVKAYGNWIKGSTKSETERNLGILIAFCNFIKISNSKIWRFDNGVRIRNSSFIEVTKNEIFQNHVGIQLAKSSDVLIYLNDFIDNNLHAMDDGAYYWDNGKVGNYWDNYNGSDFNFDGIGDIPYTIDNDSKDRYPLIKPYTEFLIYRMQISILIPLLVVATVTTIVLRRYIKKLEKSSI